MGFRRATPQVLTDLSGHVSTADAAFLLPLLPALPSPLLDKLLEYVQQTIVPTWLEKPRLK